MFKPFSKLPVSYRLWMVLMLAIPLSALCFFSARLISEKSRKAAQMELLDKTSHLSSRISDVVHELQKERGFSVGYLSSPNGAFGDELSKQRRATDEKITALKRFQDGLPDSIMEEIGFHLEEVTGTPSLLGKIRNGVDARTISYAEALDYYSKTGQLLLDSILHMPQNTIGGEINSRHLSNYYVQSIKENAGIQRAILTRAFILNRMPPQDYGILLSAVALETRYRNSFMNLAPPDLQERFRRAMENPDVKTADQMRDVPLKQTIGGPLGVDAGSWYRYQTKKMDRINEFADSLEALSLSAVDRHLAATQKSLARYQLTMAFAVSTVLFMAFFVLRNVAEVKNNEKNLALALDALERSYMEESAIMEANPDILYVFNKRGELLKWNSNFAKFCGLPPAEMLKKPALEFACEEDRETLIEGMRTVFKKGSANIEVRLIRHDGRLVPYWCNGVLLKGTDGRIAGFTGTGRDMTAQKQNEAMLKQAKEKAEEATALKDKFVSLVAHDLKSPLATMIGLLKLAAGSTPPLDEKTRLILNRAAETGALMSGLIDEVLSLSRLKTGSLKLDMKFFDAHHIGRKLALDFSYTAEQKGIELRNDIPPNSRIYADKTLLCEVIGNLVSNALKFCAAGGQVNITLEGAATICVADTGRGIDPRTLEKLFNNPVSKTGTAGETGTGYGLVLVKEVVHLHGGSLSVKSEVGKGTMFKVILPRLSPKVLVVDDDELFRRQQKLHLTELDVEIVEAANGRHALEVITDDPLHLIIVDVRMPEMGGLELLEKIKGLPETQHIPVIMVSGIDGMEIRNAVFNLGANDFVIKPWNPEDFIPRVRRFIG